MAGILETHFDAVLRLDAGAALADFSPLLVSVVHFHGESRALRYPSVEQLLKGLFASETLRAVGSGARVLVRECAGDYGVLALSLPGFADFVNYVCMVRDGKITRMTLYLGGLAEALPPVEDSPGLAPGKAAKKLFHNHALAMMSVSADVIVKDYAVDAVVVTNLTARTCKGKTEIHSFCASLMKDVWKLVRGLKLQGTPRIKWKTRAAGTGLLLFVCEAGGFRTAMTETYWVENGKIQFETSICAGKMLELVRTLH